MSTSGAKKFRRIATEEAFSIPEVANALRDVAPRAGQQPRSDAGQDDL